MSYLVNVIDNFDHVLIPIAQSDFEILVMYSTTQSLSL